MASTKRSSGQQKWGRTRCDQQKSQISMDPTCACGRGEATNDFAATVSWTIPSTDLRFMWVKCRFWSVRRTNLHPPYLTQVMFMFIPEGLVHAHVTKKTMRICKPGLFELPDIPVDACLGVDISTVFRGCGTKNMFPQIFEVSKVSALSLRCSNMASSPICHGRLSKYPIMFLSYHHVCWPNRHFWWVTTPFLATSVRSWWGVTRDISSKAQFNGMLRLAKYSQPQSRHPAASSGVPPQAKSLSWCK